MSKRFFSYSPDLGIVWHETAEAAKTSAEEELKQYRNDAKFDGEWPQEVEEIRWGEVKEATAEIRHDEEEEGCDYALKAVEA